MGEGGRRKKRGRGIDIRREKGEEKAKESRRKDRGKERRTERE